MHSRERFYSEADAGCTITVKQRPRIEQSKSPIIGAQPESEVAPARKTAAPSHPKLPNVRTSLNRKLFAVSVHDRLFPFDVPVHFEGGQHGIPWVIGPRHDLE